MASEGGQRDAATPGSAILLVIAAGLSFSFLDTSAKALVVTGISAPFVSWVRFAVHVLLFAALARPWHDLSVLKARSLPLQVLRGAFLFGSTYFNFKALQTLQRGVQAVPMNVNPATEALYIANPLSGRGMSALFSTHPPMEERIRRLRELDAAAGIHY